MASENKWVDVGDRVLINDDKIRRYGQTGMVMEFNETDDRYNVRFDDGTDDWYPSINLIAVVPSISLSPDSIALLRELHKRGAYVTHVHWNMNFYFVMGQDNYAEDFTSEQISLMKGELNGYWFFREFENEEYGIIELIILTDDALRFLLCER